MSLPYREIHLWLVVLYVGHLANRLLRFNTSITDTHTHTLVHICYPMRVCVSFQCGNHMFSDEGKERKWFAYF